jgi:hypothetical protein
MRARDVAVTFGLALVLVSVIGTRAVADPPPGDTCGSAIAITWYFTETFTGDLAPCANDYDPGIPGPSCTGSAAPGRDMVLAVEVGCGQGMNVHYTPVGFDGSIYIVTDCSDVTGSCVAGADGHGVGGAEEVGLGSSTNQTYYIIVDAHDAGTGGSFSLSFNWWVWDFPPGACCFPDGSCEVVSFDSCEPSGGVSHGPCSVCDPNPCVPTPARESSWGAIKARYR